MLKKILLSPWTALLTLALVLAVRIANPSFVENVRFEYFDQLIKNKPVTENNVYTVNIDEDTIDKYGQYPFPRDIYAKIIEDLYKRNAGLVVFNVLMSEPDRFNNDGVLAATMNEFSVVLPNTPENKNKNTPRKPSTAVIGDEHSDKIIQYAGMIANVPILEKRAVGTGTVHTKEENDGVVRRMPLVIAVDGVVYPSLAMEALRVAAQDSTTQIKLNENGVEKMRIPAFGPITTDSEGLVWIDWSQRSKSVSAVNLPKDFGGAVVIVGVAATGLGNPVPTPNGSVWPQEVQAAVLGTMFNGVNIERPDYADGIEILAILVAGVILLFLTRWIYVGLASVVVLVAVGAYGSYFAFINSLWLFDITAFISAVILVSLHAYGVKFVSEFLQKQQIKKQFGTYLSPAMVEKLQKNPELLQLGGDSRELSIMFTDVRGFTSISEHYGEDVQGLTKIMNRYMTAMTAKIIENQGTLDKYIGDAQMAFWNAPLDTPDHAKMAVKTGLEMMGSLKGFNDEISTEGVPPFGMGLGINTATVVVGNMGSDQRFDYTCLGDGVNLASRLEGQSKPYGVKIVLGQKTAEQVQDEYYVLELDKIAVKGKKVGVNIYTVLGRIDELNISDSDTQMHQDMIDMYRSKNFTQAGKLCKNLKGKFNGEMDHYYELWIERCEEMKGASLPDDWDGTFVATSK